MTPFCEPIDEAHAMSLDAVAEIRRQVNEARRRLGIPARCYERAPHTHRRET